jgi:glutamate/tyrosine decarboxylase-like PLP-dependent enzyme
LWLSLQVFGAAAFRQAIAYGFHLARYAELCIRKLPDWRLVTPACLGIVTFCYAPPGAGGEVMDGMNRAIAERCLAEGVAFVGTTKIHGKTVLRLCTINPRTTETDIAETLERLAGLGRTAHQPEA